MKADHIINTFKEELAKNGFPKEIVWLHTSQMHYVNNVLNINPLNGFASESQVKLIYEKCKDSFECGATFMLVATTANESYCTLLMDSFGSDTDYEIQPNIYFWVDEPYIKNVLSIKTRFKWFLCKRKQVTLSSLDYAFLISNAYT